MSDRDERIRQRAYGIWEREGRPEGREAEHWGRALDEIRQEGGASNPEQPEDGGTGGTAEDMVPDGHALPAEVDPDGMEREPGHGADQSVVRGARQSGIGNPLAEGIPDGARSGGEQSGQQQSGQQQSGDGGRRSAADRPPTGEGSASLGRSSQGSDEPTVEDGTDDGANEGGTNDAPDGGARASDALSPSRGMRPGRGRRGAPR
ncbi:MAG: hypothetical protein RLY86_3874 [Pseudomonadota bacterium]|jgi:hypothetical protein